MKVSLTILGEPASKANQRQLVKFGDRPALIKSKKALAYERDALRQITGDKRVMIAGRVRVSIKIYYASERPDLDPSIVLDILQTKFVKGTRQVERAGVIVNDRQVRELHIYHAIDKANPRAEIEVEEIVPGLFVELPAVDPMIRGMIDINRVMADSLFAMRRPDPF